MTAVSSDTSAIHYNTPIYLQLREIVRSKIEEGEYPPGTAIPSENDLADTYGINRITVRNAVNALVNEGMLRRVQGKGVFVVGRKVEHRINVFDGFVSSLTAGGHTSVRQLSKGVRPAGDKYANIFHISPEDEIYAIKQLVESDGENVSYDEMYVPASVVPQLCDIDSSVFSINDIFGFYNINVDLVRQSLEIVECGQKIRRLLGVADEIAVFLLEFVYYDESGRAVHAGRSYVRSDKCGFTVHL